VEYTITFGGDPEDVQVTLSGPVTLEAIAAYLADLVHDPRWRPGMQALVDVSALDPPGLSAIEIERLADLHATLKAELGPGRRALVTGDSRIMFGLARKWQAHADTRAVAFPAAVFRTREEATLWLRDDTAPSMSPSL
jgi:hypothetical protein